MKPKIVIILMLFCLTLAVVILGNLGKNSTPSSNETFVTNLGLEAPNIKDKNLAQFYLWTKEDPLFTSPNFNPKTFLDSITALKNEEDAYLRQTAGKTKIYPIAFLSEIVKADNMYKKFINNPTKESAGELIAQDKSVVLKYKNDIGDLLEVISSFDPSVLKQPLRGIITATAGEVKKKDLQKILANANALEAEIDNREKCLITGAFCKRPALGFSSFKLEKANKSFSEKDLLSKDLLPDFPKSSKWYGPYIVSTPCFGFSSDLKPIPQLIYLILDNSDKSYQEDTLKLDRFYIKLATDNYYSLQLSQFALKTASDSSRTLVKHESNSYLCSNQEFKPKIAAIDYLYRTYKNKPVFKDLLSKNDLSLEQKTFFSEGEGLEKAFFESRFPSETDANNLANYYGLLYKKLIIWRNDIKNNNKPWLIESFRNRDQFLVRKLEYERELGNIDKHVIEALGSFANYRINMVLSPVKSKNDDAYKINTYVYRNMGEILYFPFSPSFYRSSDYPTYIYKKNMVVGGPRLFKSYSMLLKLYPKTVIASWKLNSGLNTEQRYSDFLKSHPNFKN